MDGERLCTLSSSHHPLQSAVCTLLLLPVHIPPHYLIESLKCQYSLQVQRDRRACLQSDKTKGALQRSSVDASARNRKPRSRGPSPCSPRQVLRTMHPQTRLLVPQSRSGLIVRSYAHSLGEHLTNSRQVCRVFPELWTSRGLRRYVSGDVPRAMILTVYKVAKLEIRSRHM